MATWPGTRYGASAPWRAFLHRVHHAIGADGDQPADRVERHHPLAEAAFGVGDHRLDDVAAEVAVLRPLRLDRRAEIGGPHHLIGRRLDLLALEQIGAVPVAGEVQHPAALRLQRPGDREQHGVAEAAAGQQHRLVRRDLGRRPGRAHHHHRFARLQERAQPARHAHLQRDERQQAGLAIHPGAGEGDALHQQRRDVIVGVHADTAALEVLQAVELARMEVPRRGRGPHDHLDDRRRQPRHPLDPRQQLVVEAAPPAPARRGRAPAAPPDPVPPAPSAKSATTLG